ncbi:MAG: hypothetical protein LBD29_05655 [Treponema sp.]|jgi:hypothetical protein|nr:hypothetical protein [Treponema sp.]
MDGIFTFQHLRVVEDAIIKEIVQEMTFDELAKALYQEDVKIRKRFYNNMPSLDDRDIFDKKLHGVKDLAIQEKKYAQRKILAIIAKKPEYQNLRFENGFESIEAFESYITKQREPEVPYGLVTQDVLTGRFIKSEQAEQALQDIKLKNKEAGMGNVRIPGSKIKLINYSVCPQCGRVYSAKDLAGYYANPKPDSRFRGAIHQSREDTRVFCALCKSYFFPSLLIIVNDIPENEVQLLSMMQTMHAIEQFYEGQQVQVLSRRQENLLRTDRITVKTAQIDNEAKDNFVSSIFYSKSDTKGTVKKVVKGLGNDIFLKDLEAAPTLICNMLYYTPPNLILNLIDGTNTAKKDVLFGLWQ